MAEINFPLNPNQSKNPNEDWRSGKEVIPEQKAVVVLRKNEKEMIPVSDVWSHRYETKTLMPETSHREGEVHQNPESLTGLASFFLLVQPDESKIKFVGWILLVIVVFFVSRYYYFRFMEIIERRQRKRADIKLAIEKNKEQEEEDQKIGFC